MGIPKLDSQKVALSWLELGIQPVPLKPRSKQPKAKKKWNKVHVTKETIPEHFSKGDNVGGLWGLPSGWIIDIDLDWDESVSLAPHFLPDTFIYGTGTRPCSHYLYRCLDIPSSKRRVPGESVMIEVRSTGSQSVLPPSIHPETRRRYEINLDLKFKEITPKKLNSLLNDLACASVLLRHYPESGARHDYIHAMTGAFLHAGWKTSRVQRLVFAVIEEANERDKDRKQRERTVKNTIDHFKQGNKIAGWPTLAEHLSSSIVQALRKWASDAIPASVIKEGSSEDDEIKIHPFTIPPMPPELLQVPGLVGDIREWCSRQAYLQQPALDLAAALMCVALTSMNKFVIDQWDTPLQPYFMILAPTSAGKGAALRSVAKFARHVNLHTHVYEGFQSFFALFDTLAEAPHLACWLWDEAARHLSSARSTGSADYSTLSHIINLYGRAQDDVMGQPGRRQSIPALDNPFLTVFAAAQPDALIESLSVSALNTGFVNRIVLFDSGDDVPPVNANRDKMFPSALKKKAIALRESEMRGGDPIRVRFNDTKTYSLFQSFDEFSRHQSNLISGSGENELWGRANQNALIIAGVVAIGIDSRRPKITQEIANWSIKLVRWSITCWIARIGLNVSRSAHERASKLIERYLREVRKYPHRTRPGEVKFRQLMSRGLMPAQMLVRLCRQYNKREIDGIVEQLIDAELVGKGIDDDSDATVYWVKD